MVPSLSTSQASCGRGAPGWAEDNLAPHPRSPALQPQHRATAAHSSRVKTQHRASSSTTLTRAWVLPVYLKSTVPDCLQAVWASNAPPPPLLWVPSLTKFQLHSHLPGKSQPPYNNASFSSCHFLPTH
uniref:Uncharacterized protein n=1 Tax=Macaca fascicularis TaxID=9541 RepID=A0A2K5UDJ2_MACFA